MKSLPYSGGGLHYMHIFTELRISKGTDEDDLRSRSNMHRKPELD